MVFVHSFNFGKTTAATTATTGFSLGTSMQTPASTQSVGFNFGTPSSGFSLGTPGSSAPQPTTTVTGFGLAAPALGATSSLFGTTTTTCSVPTGFSLSQPASSGFSLGATGASSGLSLGNTSTGTSSGFSLGGTTSSGTSSGFNFGGTTSFGAASTAAPAFGFAKPIPATTTASSGFGLTSGLKLGTTTTTSSSTLGGLTGFGSTLSTSTLGGGSIFGQSVAKTASSGLGGVDPKTTASTTAADSGKPGENKIVKEMPVENPILLDVDQFRKFVKDEKSEMEQMKRMSTTPMVKIQEDNAALKQLLSVVSSGLQKNACAVDKLKREMTQELKNAEMAIRTKETPPGLQYENTAPTLYFQSVIENFETQMLTYRQQIEMLENHLSSVHQPNRLTPEELILLLRKLHEAFVAMAAQLQQIHESVKTQKEHYLNYRKVFHGDTRNIFERQKKAPVKVTHKAHHDMYGHAPFPAINNAAAVAMATALSRTQQPQPTAGAPPVTGFSNFQASTGFGSTPSGFGAFGASTTQASGFKGFGTGTSGFGTSTSSTGFGTGSSLFGNTSNLATTQTGSLFSSTLSSTTPGLNLSTSTEQPFQLNKPPLGSKRGKR